jgi:hypothetical protein
MQEERRKIGQLGAWNFWSDRAKDAFRTWGFQEQTVDAVAVKQSRSKVFFIFVCLLCRTDRERFVYFCAACAPHAVLFLFLDKTFE